MTESVVLARFFNHTEYFLVIGLGYTELYTQTTYSRTVTTVGVEVF